MIEEHDLVVSNCEFSELGLEAGDIGTVIHVYRDGEAFEVEFVTLDGETIAIATVTARQIRPIAHREIAHARRITV